MKVASVAIITFIRLCVVLGVSQEKKNTNPQTSQILQTIKLASQLT
jgi:hypothetical protein